MRNYIYQKFLLNCDYEGMDMDTYPHFSGKIEQVLQYGTERTILDCDKQLIRRIKLEDLDDLIDTEDDWKEFILSLSGVGLLVLEGCSRRSNNPVINEYRISTLKAYLYYLSTDKINVQLAK